MHAWTCASVCVRAFESIYIPNIHLHVHAFTTRYYMSTHLQCVCVRPFVHPHHRSFIFIVKNFIGTHTLNMSTETPGMERQRQNLSASMLQVNSCFQYLEGEKDFSMIIQSDAVTRIWPCSGVWSPSACLRRKDKDIFLCSSREGSKESVTQPAPLRQY